MFLTLFRPGIDVFGKVFRALFPTEGRLCLSVPKNGFPRSTELYLENRVPSKYLAALRSARRYMYCLGSLT
jgi:hypothetical protein